MADRFPLIYNPSAGQIQELGAGDNLDLTASGIVNAGVITATQLSTGANGVGISTNTISGPTELIIDPAAVGDNTGSVRIRGDLYVDGTQTYINSSSIELADFNVGIATTVGTNILLDGAGIGIGSTNIRKTITWNNSVSALTSSEDWNLVSGKQYEINGTSVLNSTTLGSGVTSSSLTSVGTLGQLNVTGIVTVSNLRSSETRLITGSEKVFRTSGNTVNLIYNSSSGSNIGYTTNPTGDITLNVNGIPTTSDFDDHSITFAVIVNNTGTARTCTAVNLNGFPETIRWIGGSLGAALAGVTTTNGHTIFSFTGINTVGSASTTSNYTVFGTVSGGFW